MKAKKFLSLLLALVMVFTLLPAAAVSADAAPAGERDSELDLAAALADGTYQWVASNDGSCYTLAYVTYVANPMYAEDSYEADIKYQQITIFVPAAYVDGINEDGTLDINYGASIANGDGDEVYTAYDAPIYFACESPGYSENACSDSLGGMSDNSEYLNAGMIVVNVGHRGKGTSIQAGGETVYTGKAPWSLVDSKAAIMYLRMNDDLIPGSADRIVSSASSGGGALSGMIGATGDYGAYLPYLYEIGAAGVSKNEDGTYNQLYSNAVYASNLWCPILNVDYSDAAYEAFYGPGTRSGSTNDFQLALSEALAESFSEYIAAFGFEGIENYEDFLNGPFAEAVAASANEQLYSMVNGYAQVTWLEDDDETPVTGDLTEAEMAAKFIAGYCEITSAGMGGQMSTSNADPIDWLAYEDGKLVITDMEKCVAGLNTGNKSITGFDGIIANMTENQPFGDEENNYKHFSASYLAEIEGNEALEAAFNGYGYEYTLKSETTEVPDGLTSGAEKRLTTTTYSVVVDAEGVITVDKSVKVEDVKASSGRPGMGGPGGSSNEVVAVISDETTEGYFVSGTKEEHKDEVVAAGVVIGLTAGQYASGMESYAAWVADFKAEVESQIDEYGNNLVDLYNPMNFIMGTDQGGSGTEAAYDTATPAQHWRVRHGTTDANSAPVIATLLNLALEDAKAQGKIESVDFLLPWEGPHGVVEAASDDLVGWIADVWEPIEGMSPAEIEYVLNLDNMDQTWTYSDGGWVLTPVVAVADPVLPGYEGVSVCVPGAYVKGIDTDGDGSADVTAEEATGPVAGALVIDYGAEITSTNGQKYTAATAPLILNTGAAGYGDQGNQSAGTGYVAEGYINIVCGNRGKQSQVTDEDGNVLCYTGDAPSCLVDQKAATRFVKYNILLGNLPGNVNYLVSTGGSGGGAHASMFAATSNNPDFYDYQIEVGAVGVYRNEDGTYSTSVTINGEEVEISDGAWGSIAYSTISSLYEADMTQAFEYYMDTTYEFNSEYEKKLAGYLSETYMDYINAKGLTDAEGNPLTIEFDLEKYPDTNGYGGTYLDYYLAEFTENLQWYVDNLDYAEGWTWFDEDGNAVDDLEGFDKAAAFIEGRYAKASSGGMGGPGGPDMSLPGGLSMTDVQAIAAAIKDMATDAEKIAWIKENYPAAADISEDEMNQILTMAEMFAGGGPGMGGGSSVSYADFAEMAAAWIADVEAVYEGDRFGKNQVYLYNPLNYIGAEGTENPTWAKIIMGAVEGDIAMMNSMNLELAWLEAGTDMTLEWQWDGGHVPSEVLGDSFALTVDQMYAKHVADAPVKTIGKAPAAAQANGSAAVPTGDDHSAWVSIDGEGRVSFTLADVLAYRNTGASKAVPGFDVESGEQENYVFGNEEIDSRHWDIFVARIFSDPEKAAVLEPLYNAAKGIVDEPDTPVIVPGVPSDEEEPADDSFYSDVSEGDWFYNEVKYVHENGLMNGVGGSLFAPNAAVTRAMAVTTLYRLAGSPGVSGANPFTDLEQDWYMDAVQWAFEAGVTKGTSETTFDPDTVITREQLAAMFYRYAQYCGLDVSVGKDTDILSYTDAQSISDWAMDAMQWACGSGLIRGVGNDTLAPTADSSRAQLAAMLMRYCEEIAK